MTTATTKRQRRHVHYTTLAELQADAEQLAAGEYETVGNWTFGQILQHLASGINSSIDGFNFKASWFLRAVVAPLIKNSVLTKPMKAGYQIPKSAGDYLPPPDITTTTALKNLQAAIERLKTETPTAAHPVFGKMASQEWLSLHLRHAELHMSFVVPADGDES